MPSPIIFADHHSTTPVDPVVSEVMRRATDELWGNPSSTHAHGRAAAQACETARGQVADLMGCEPDEVLFTSGATEANNLAMKAAARWAKAHGRRHLVTSAIEHPSVLEVCEVLGNVSKAGDARRDRAQSESQCRLSVLPVGPSGILDPREAEKVIDHGTGLVTLMRANNEVGTIQPVEQVAAIARAHGALVHVDACQSFGRVPLDPRLIDLATVSGHKMYGPKGVGALYIRRGLRECLMSAGPEMVGGTHEGGLRAGTLPTAAIVGFGVACDLMRQRGAMGGFNGRAPGTESLRLSTMRDVLWERLLRGLGTDAQHGGEGAPLARLNGTSDFRWRLAHNLNFTLVGVCPQFLSAALSPFVSVSGAAACRGPGASKVLAAMGDVAEDGAAVRVGLGRFNTWQDIDGLVNALVRASRTLYGSGCPIPQK